MLAIMASSSNGPESSWMGQGWLAVLGPENLSYNDLAAIMTDVLDLREPSQMGNA
jgi:hypothetical protein